MCIDLWSSPRAICEDKSTCIHCIYGRLCKKGHPFSKQRVKTLCNRQKQYQTREDKATKLYLNRKTSMVVEQ